MADGSTPRRFGWWVLAAVGGVVVATLVLGGAVAVTADVRDHQLGAAFKAFTGTAAGVVFWVWITLGARRRIHDALAPDPPEPASRRWGPAAMVANGVLVLLFTALIGLGIWASVDARGDRHAAEKLRDRVNLAVHRADLTRAAVADARSRWLTESWSAPAESAGAADPMTSLLDVPGATVVDLAVDDHHAAILIRPDHGSLCVVVDIDRDDLSSTRITDRCS